MAHCTIAKSLFAQGRPGPRARGSMRQLGRMAHDHSRAAMPGIRLPAGLGLMSLRAMDVTEIAVGPAEFHALPLVRPDLAGQGLVVGLLQSDQLGDNRTNF